MGNLNDLDPVNKELVELVDLACQLANSVQDDVEEDPNAASNTTVILLQQFREKLDQVNTTLDTESGMQ